MCLFVLKLPELDLPNIHIRDRGKVDELMSNLIQGGPGKLQVSLNFVLNKKFDESLLCMKLFLTKGF